VKLHKDVRSRHSLGMHFATFAGSDVEAMEPLLELVESREKEEVGDWTEEGGFGTINVGETATIELL
jgi:N-acyl-phosphatidylethanolamine-hydrolysing phospholipase D